MKKRYLLLILLSFFFFKGNVLALEGTLNCNKQEVSPGTNFECKVAITTTSDENFKELKASFDIDNFSIKIVKITGLNDFTSNSDSSLDLINTKEVTGTNEVALIEFSVDKDTTNFGDANISITSDSLNTNISSVVKILSNNNKLKRINIANIKLTPNFDPNHFDYEVKDEVTTDIIVVNATLDDERASFVEGYEPKEVKLKNGENKIIIRVRAENGDIREYSLKITKKGVDSNNNYLKSLSLSIGTLTPRFNRNTLEYNVKVPLDIDKIKLEAILDDKNASFIENYGPREEKIKVGDDNHFEIQVMAQNGEIRTYKINVKRGDDDNNNLSSLSIANVNIDFDKDVTEYEFNVLYDVTELNISALAEKNTSKITIEGNKDFVVGLNIVTIKVVSESNDEKIYTLKVTRLEQGNTLSSNNELKSLIIQGYVIPFHKDTLNYYVKTKEKQLYIEAIPDSDTSTVKIVGNDNLKDGSIIEIIVTSEDLSQRTYTITIEKESNGFIIFLIILIILLIIGGILLIIFRKKIFKQDDIKPKEELEIKKDDKERIIIEDDVDDVQVFTNEKDKEDDLDKTKDFSIDKKSVFDNDDF